MGALRHTFLWRGLEALLVGVIEREGEGRRDGLGAVSEDLSLMLAFVC